MSGIEIAVLILKALPTAVETLKKCNEAIGEVKKWIRYKKEVQSLIRTLENERLRLENAYEKLLIGVVPPSRIEAMIADPEGRHWKEEETQRKIRARLWRSYKRFEEIMDEMKDAVNKFEGKIAPLAELGRKVSLFKRTSFTINRADFADELTTIKDGITSIEEMTMQNMELEPARRVRSQGRFLNILRNLSKSLFRALCCSLGCTCIHDISLRLESRSGDHVSPGYADEEIMQDIAFQLVFSAKDSDTHESSCWKEVLVKVAPPERRGGVLPSTISIRSRPSSPGPLPAKNPRRGKMKAVSFGRSHSSAKSTTTIVEALVDSASNGLQDSIPTLTMGMASIGLLNFGTTMNLCEQLRKAQKEKRIDCYGIISDDSSPVRRQYAVCPPPPADERGDGSVWSTVSLKEMLECSPPPLHARLQLAVAVSSSILQLHNTPWLPEFLDSTNIFFLKQGNYPLYSDAFVIKKLPESKSPPVSSQPSYRAHVVRNPVLLYLGILLIELFLGKTFDSLRPKAQEENQLHAVTRVLADIIAAQELVQQIRQTSANYGSAVSRCINGDFGGSTAGDLDDEDFRQLVYSSVVTLIEKAVENP